MRLWTLAIAAIPFAFNLLAAQPQALTCRDEVIEKFPISEIGGGCRPYSMLFYATDYSSSQFVDELSCHFANQRTLYAYQVDGEIRLDIRGDADESSTEKLEDCNELLKRIEELKKDVPRSSLPMDTGSFAQNEGILLVASEQTCQKLSTQLNDYVTLLRSEGRWNSDVYCWPQKRVLEKNPSVLRRDLQKPAKRTDGILLIGDDLPVFEFFARWDQRNTWSADAYAQSDLPFGNWSSPFWDQPLKKNQKPLREFIYKSKDFVYPIKTPTAYAFDFGKFAKSEQVNPLYRQEKWVSRWVGNPESLKESFEGLVKRRKNYRPFQAQKIFYAQGNVAYMFRPGETNSWSSIPESLEFWKSNSSRSFSFESLIEVDLEQAVRFINPNFTMAILSEHGQPEGFGNIHSNSFISFHALPPLVVLDTCLGGAWGYATSVGQSLVSKFFSMKSPPVAILASGGIKSMPFFGPVNGGDRPLLTFWKGGQSLGQRQKESINENLDDWRANPKPNNLPAEMRPVQIFHAMSLYGDASLEF